MNIVYKQLALTAVLSIGFGVLAIVPVVNGGNGYAAGFVFFPLFLLIILTALVLLVAGIVETARGKNGGPFLLVAALLLPGSFILSSLTAKQLELGAYREEPLVPLIPTTSNIVLFNKDVTENQIGRFLEETTSAKRDDGRGYEHLPGLRSLGRLSARDGHEVVEFSFFASATDEQRKFVFSRVRSSPIVFKVLENVPTKDYMPINLPSIDNRSKADIKTRKPT